MSIRNKNAQELVSGRMSLPADFTTAYKRDIEIAREMIRLRREGKDDIDETGLLADKGIRARA